MVKKTPGLLQFNPGRPGGTSSISEEFPFLACRVRGVEGKSTGAFGFLFKRTKTLRSLVAKRKGGNDAGPEK